MHWKYFGCFSLLTNSSPQRPAWGSAVRSFPSASTNARVLPKTCNLPESHVPRETRGTPGKGPTVPCFVEAKAHQPATRVGTGYKRVLPHSAGRGRSALNPASKHSLSKTWPLLLPLPRKGPEALVDTNLITRQQRALVTKKANSTQVCPRQSQQVEGGDASPPLSRAGPSSGIPSAREI